MKIMRKFFICLLFLFFSLTIGKAQVTSGGVNANSQSDTLKKTVLDNSQYRVYYSTEFINDTLSINNKTTCTTVLLIGSKNSCFIDYGLLRQDSVFDSLTKRGASTPEIISNTIAIARTAKFKNIVLRNYPSINKNTIQTSVGSTKYNYIDEKIDIKWKLGNEEKEIEGFKCKNAFCNFRGRDYVAWYSPEISVSEGPYLFTGLPGLIMEIYDTKEYYRFFIAGLERISHYDPIYILTDKVANLSREQVRKLVANSYADPSSLLKNLSGSMQNISEESIAKSSARPYNPIEIE